MFKNLIVALFAVLVMSVSAMAADTFQMETFNLGGDTHYIFGKGLAFGGGVDVMSILDTVGIRGVYAKPMDVSDVSDYVGIGAGINISEVAKRFGGVCLLNSLNTSIGVSGLVDMNTLTHEGKFEGDMSVYLTLIQVIR